jgi:Protein of unknown function (DUF2924)
MTLINSSNPSITAQLAQLPELSMDSLWAMWDAHFDQRPKHHHRAYLESRLAYRLQERALSALPQSVRKRLEKIGETGIVPRLTQRDSNRILPGTVLSREWNGMDYRVHVISHGEFALDGRRFSSLTAVAKFITGTPWSGPKFFGLPTQSRSKVAGERS